MWGRVRDGVWRQDLDRLRLRHRGRERTYGIGLGRGKHVPAQLFFAALMVNPALHSLHMAAPCLVQKVPLIATPLSHVHVLADTHAHTHTHTHTRTNIDNHVNGVTLSF